MIFRFTAKEAGGHTHISIAAGKTKLSLGKAGDICLRNEEWEALRRGLVYAPTAGITIEIFEPAKDISE